MGYCHLQMALGSFVCLLILRFLRDLYYHLFRKFPHPLKPLPLRYRPSRLHSLPNSFLLRMMIKQRVFGCFDPADPVLDPADRTTLLRLFPLSEERAGIGMALVAGLLGLKFANR